MKRYLVLLLAAAMLLPMLVVAAGPDKRLKRTINGIQKHAATYQERQAQATSPDIGKPMVVQAAKFAKSIAVRDFPVPIKSTRQPGPLSGIAVKNEESAVPVSSAEVSRDGALQTRFPDAPTVLPTPSVNFEGLSARDTAALNAGSFSFPPDTVIDVGPNHVVEMTNTTFRVYGKTGTPLTPVARLSTLFAGLGAPCGTLNNGDPIALYDAQADRWNLSQFCLPTPGPNVTTPGHVLIAISQTPDPTGAYYLYDFVTPKGLFPDYPKLGVWSDGYYMSTRQFASNATGAGVFAFDRDKMLKGEPASTYIYFDVPLIDPTASLNFLPADIDGLTPPPPGAPCPFAFFTADEHGTGPDGMKFYDFHADFATPANSTFTVRPEGIVAVAAFDPTLNESSLTAADTFRDDIDQPVQTKPTPVATPTPTPNTAGQRLDGIADRIMHRLAYRNFGAHESLVVTHTVDVNATPSNLRTGHRAGIRYYEFRKSGAGPYSVFEQATYAGALGDTTHRWMGSAAQDYQGNIAVGYSVSSSTVYPGIRYAARLTTDPSGGLMQGEQSIIEGSGIQKNTGSRWGDYSSLNIDPSDDATFWFATEYFTAAEEASTCSACWQTRIGAFKLPGTTAAPIGSLQGTVTDGNGNPIQGALVKSSDGYVRVTDANGAYSFAMMAPGLYTMTASAPGYQPTTQGVAVVNGGTSIANFVLAQKVAVVASGAATLAAENCNVPNGAIDPGETVTVNVPLRNEGAAGTSNVQASILPGGGVILTPQSTSQNYGALPPNGAPVSRQFTFLADPTLLCGGTITLTLYLTDNGNFIGTVSFTLTVGVQRSISYENFDGVTAPALPPGWTTAATGGGTPWVTRATAGTSDTAPNHAFSPNPTTHGDSSLTSPSFPVTSHKAQVTFRHLYNMEGTFDGGVLEISVDGGPFADILAAGGSFAQNGYTAALAADPTNPLGGRQAWTHQSGGYITTIVNLPASVAGKNIRLRWRLGADDGNGVTVEGWRVDTIVLRDGSQCCTPTISDIDRDFKTDIGVYKPTSGNWYFTSTLDNSFNVVNWGFGTDIIVPGDYDGDGKVDPAVWRAAEGNWYIRGTAVGGIVVGWGQSGDIPAQADYDGDAKTDYAVFRPGENNWYIKQSSNNATRVQGWGTSGDQLIPADFDGDGKADITVFRAGEGNWYSLGTARGTSTVRNWGITGDVAVPADYDGDGKADLAVYRVSEGNWYIIQSSNNGGIIRNWGGGSDIPVPGDYDGDRKADIAVYRPSDGNWFIIRSTDNSTMTLNLNIAVTPASDVPVPRGYRPQ
ncbi:MAG TPA: carboxypeptidase regulatory-like domain-containing protein [Pyrinomonadaceae bacterium]